MTKTAKKFYVAVGDSMSMDIYPAYDVDDRYKGGTQITGTGVGAASLLHTNADSLWPKFRGRDLSSHFDEIGFLDLTSDGATTRTVLEDQLPQLEAEGGREVQIVTLTVGGNDLLNALQWQALLEEGLEAEVEAIGERIMEILDELQQRYPSALILPTTTYDPTDGTGLLPGVSEQLGRLPIELLDRLNDQVRRLASNRHNVLLADVHQHFLGHGVSARELDRWYWPTSIIEPGARGASEIRRVWLGVLEEAQFMEPDSPEDRAIQVVQHLQRERSEQGGDRPIEFEVEHSWLDETRNQYMLRGYVTDANLIRPGMNVSIPWHAGFGHTFRLASVEILDPREEGLVSVGIDPDEDDDDGATFELLAMMDPHDELLLIWEPDAKIDLRQHYRFGLNEPRQRSSPMPGFFKFRPNLPK